MHIVHKDICICAYRDLTNNKITSVTASTFLNQVSLTDLDLDNNLLTTISKDVFTPLINLRNL